MRKVLFFILLLSVVPAPVRAQALNGASEYDALIRGERNLLQYLSGRDAMESFYGKLDTLLLYGQGRVKVWHVGDSHIQADMLTNRLRYDFATVQYGMEGVRGNLYPFTIEKTNYLKNYRMPVVGSWSWCNNVQRSPEYEMGMNGRAVCTEDSSAAVGLVLNDEDSISWRFSRLIVNGYGSSDEVSPYVLCNGREVRGVRSGAGFVINLDSNCDEYLIRFHIPDGESFVLTGIIPDNDKPGISYFSSGVNGANVNSWLKCSRVEQELADVRPDLVVVALGVNDCAGPAGKFDAESFKSGYRELVGRIRRASPGCALLFVTGNDIRWRGKANVNGPLMQKSILDLAKEFGAAVWDFFDIMGGLGSMDVFVDAGLGQSDYIHFTKSGYELQADLMFNAIMSDYLSGRYGESVE